MKSRQLVRATIAICVICLAAGSITASAQSVEPKLRQASASSRPAQNLFSEANVREAVRQTSPAPDQQATPKQERSWVSRHKILTAVIIGAVPFVIWGALLYNTCHDGGC